jgi:pyochelin biosynthesis protein PchC
VSDKDTQWIRCFHASPDSDMRLVCFPHAGGSATYYFPMSRALAPAIEVLALQYPGRQDRRLEKCIDSIPDLANRIYGVLKSRVEPPFAYFGHSMGATLAFEVARRFQLRPPGPVRIFASGRCAPSRRRAGEPIHLRDDAGLLAELRRGGATDPRVLDDEDLRAAILPMARSDYKAIETYACAPGAQLDCPITVLVGDCDPQVTIDEAAAWGEHSAGGSDLHVFPGGHFYLEACQEDVIATISATLETVCSVNSVDGGTL